MAESTKRQRQTSRDHGSAELAGDSYEALQKQLADGLVMLRAEFREALETYSVFIQGLATQVGDALAESPSGLTAVQRRARLEVLQRAFKDLDALKLKPAKGRRKDLKRIETFITDLCDTIAEW